MVWFMVATLTPLVEVAGFVWTGIGEFYATADRGMS